MKMGLRPAIIFGYENPLYACRFYFNLEKYTRDFDHAFVWSSTRELLSPKTKFHDAVYRPPGYPKNFKVKADFRKRKFLSMINRNNRIHPLRRLYVNVMQMLRPLPTLLNRELYLDRLTAIKYFSKDSGFDLYGTGWERPTGQDRELQTAIKKSYRGYVQDKFKTLENYKFSLCFEPVIFGGFVSEKIIDSLFAGCVPVYYGAPDVTGYIPKNCFIDFRDFSARGGSQPKADAPREHALGGKNYKELDAYLKGIDEKTYNKYINNINNFISSPRYALFGQERFSEEIINILETYF